MNLSYRLVFQTYKRLYKALPPLARPRNDGLRRVMLYHNVEETPSPFLDRLGITMSPENFETHVRYLLATYRVVPFSRVLDEADGSGAMAITFDDGYRSIVDEVLPIVERLSCPIKVYLNGPTLDGGVSWLNKLSYLCAVLDETELRALFDSVSATPAAFATRSVSPFIDAFSLEVVERIDSAFDRTAPAHTPRIYLDRDEVRRLAAHPLVELGSHTRRHYPLNRLDDDVLHDEVSGFHTAVKSEFGSSIDGFCVPFGYREHVTESAARAIADVDSRIVTAYGGRVDGSELHGVPELRRIGAWGNLGVLWHQLKVHGS